MEKGLSFRDRLCRRINSCNYPNNDQNFHNNIADLIEPRSNLLILCVRAGEACKSIKHAVRNNVGSEKQKNSQESRLRWDLFGFQS
jgi:hypothetical protein